ncbi:unnamed protein product, partial [Scytosiphon promiscuus]
PGSPEASSACDEIVRLAIGGNNDERNPATFTIITKESLTEMAKANSLTGKRALAQALVWKMARDRDEGLALKRNKTLQDNEKGVDLRDEDNEIVADCGEILDENNSQGGLGEEVNKTAKTAGTCGTDNTQECQDEEGDEGVIAKKQAEREKVKLELRAARLFTTIDDDLGAPDRVYILQGFPATETDAAQFLEENNAYFTQPIKNRKSPAQSSSSAKTGNRPSFFSALDAVVQLTTRELARRAVPSPNASSDRTGSRPGTASSCGSARSAQDNQPSPRGRWKETEETTDPRKRESTWEKLHIMDSQGAPNPFTQASGVTKALAVAQTKGGTVWQDLSFCYINIFAPPADPDAKDVMVRSLSSELKPEKAAARGNPKIVAEIKDVLRLAEEFKEMVTQMAFEKFDFHQWFSTAEIVSLPRTDNGVDVVRAIAEAQQTETGPLASSSGVAGSAARMDGSLWATDPLLLAYSEVMLALPDELSSVAVAVNSLVGAVMLDYTGTIPRPLDVTPPATLPPRANSRITSNAAPSMNVKRYSKTTASTAAPLADGCLGHALLSVNLDAQQTESGDDSWTEGTDVSTLAFTENLPQCALARNVVVEFGDTVGERATRSALNRAAAFGETRVDPRAVVALERAALAKLQNPRLVGQGALPHVPERTDKDRETEQCELLSFTDLGKKDVDRTRQVWSLANLVNARHPPPGQGELWTFESRRYWDVLPPHAVHQVLRAENGTEPTFLRQYYPLNFRPSFKNWAGMAVAKDSNYTPRTLAALGAVMDVSKADLDRAKTKSVKLFPADHSLVVLSGFVATLDRWLSVFKDGHVIGLRLVDTTGGATPRGVAGNPRHTDMKGAPTKQASPPFPTDFIMSFDDDSRIVIKEGHPRPPSASSRPASSKGETRKSTTKAPAPSPPATTFSSRSRNGREEKPDGFGTMRCVQTFPTGLVVSIGSDGTVGMKFVVDSKRGPKGKFLNGSMPEAAKDEFARAVVGRGTVVRNMRDGSTQMLFATGDVVTRNGDETTLTDKWGRCFKRAETTTPGVLPNIRPHTSPLAAQMASPSPDFAEPSRGEWVPVDHVASVPAKALGGTFNTANRTQPGGDVTQPEGRFSTSKGRGHGTQAKDAETGAVVWCPPGGSGRVVAVYDDGLTVTRHADGTVQRLCERKASGQDSAAGPSFVLVECPGFASVEVDIEIEEMCSKHAKGEPVNIIRGGNRTRLRAVMPNGGVTLVTYDTRVTSQVCGRIVYVHSDNTEIIASDNGEIVVRPRGMWEGKPMHGILAGPNSSMPPNAAQPDLLVGTYTFDCAKGILDVEDTDRNRFVLDVTKTAFLREGFSISRVGGSTANGSTSPTVARERGDKGKRASSRPSSGKSDGVTIDLSGEAGGVRSEALVNKPLEPRLFVYRRDGSALELLRNDDAQNWCVRISRMSPAEDQQQKPQLQDDGDDYGGGQVSAEGATRAVDVREHECRSDPHSQAVRQLSFYVPLLPTSRGEGSFAALIRSRSDRVFGDDYDYEGRCGQGNVGNNSSWRTRPLPFAARTASGAPLGISGHEGNTAMEACIRRVWLEHAPLSNEAAEELRRSLAEWEIWKRTRAEQIDRFLVSDPRPADEVEAQRSVQKRIRKAFREAKVAKQKAKEKARAARAQAAKEQHAAKNTGLSGSYGDTAATASTLTLGEPSAAESTFGEVDPMSVQDNELEDGDVDDIDFPDSDDEEEDEETALLRAEAESAFASAGGGKEGHLDIPALRVAMVTVLGKAIKDSEAERYLNGLRKRTFPQQSWASQHDLFHILLGVHTVSPPSSVEGRTTQPLQPGASIVTTPGTSYEDVSTHCDGIGAGGQASLKGEDHPDDLGCPAASSSATSASTAIRTRLKPPLMRSFWETPFGRSLNSS